MAKGNLLLGTAKNSVGDVVMYRREGAQITRVRVRNVKNPKTNAQSFQRAIMAPIAKFYSPLSVVLERSFEGLSKAKSHNKFNQVNAGLARKNKWALPKGTGFFPLPYQLSQGTIPAILYSMEVGTEYFNVPIGSVEEAVTTVGQLSSAFINKGYQEGDIVTILIMAARSGAGSLSLKNSYYPISVQFAIKEDDATLLTNLNKSLSITVTGTDSAILVVHPNNTSCAGGAVIIARFDGNMWRRSTQSLLVTESLMTEVTSNAAVAAAIASYGMTAGDGNPLVYLDGDELADGE